MPPRFLAGSAAMLALSVVPHILAGCSSAEDLATDETDLVAQSCLPTLACAAPPPPVVSSRGWRHGLRSPSITMLGAPNHRGRDLFLNPGDEQTIIAKFTYGIADKDLEDEEVDVFVQRDCTKGWEKLGTTITTSDGNAPDRVEGVPAANGRIYFKVPRGKELGLGRHRVRLVVAGDGSSTELFIDVVPPKTPIFISDVDGTLTSSESVELVKLLTGDIPDTHPGAPEALRALVAKGYRPIYVTARPEWLTQRTRDFLDKHGFPPGIVRTSTSLTGAGLGASAVAYKQGEIHWLASKGLVPAFGFGNETSDADVYEAIPVKNRRIFFQLDGDLGGGRRIGSYAELLPELARLPAACR